jgi:hypothetical protein
MWVLQAAGLTAVETDLAPELKVGYAGDGPPFPVWQRMYLHLLVQVA